MFTNWMPTALALWGTVEYLRRGNLWMAVWSVFVGFFAMLATMGYMIATAFQYAWNLFFGGVEP